jgi:glycolate oxidase
MDRQLKKAGGSVANRIPTNSLETMVGKENLRTEGDSVSLSPESSQAVSEIVALAQREGFKILPLGRGSILDPRKIAGAPFVVLRSDKLSKLVEVVPQDLYVIVQAGFPLRELNKQLESHNLFYPLGNPDSAGTVGGSLATNLRGKSGEKDLQTREYVLAVEVVDPLGQILKVGARTFKSVTGYDLARLYVGSWGTLGFITEVSLRLVPARKRKDYPSVTFHQPSRHAAKDKGDLKIALSSRIKKTLDPKNVFLDFDALV